MVVINRAVDFLPKHLLIETIDGFPDDPGYSVFKGFVLVVDISDSTKLANRLCSQGKVGLERLRIVMESAFNSYLQCIHKNDGYIACFSGDSIQAYWPDIDFNAKSVVNKCALELINLTKINQNVRDASPDLHVGIGYGDIQASRIGGADGKWKFLIFGDSVVEACNAESAAENLRIAFGPSAQQFLDSSTPLAIQVLKQTQPDFNFEFDDNAILAMLPNVVAERHLLSSEILHGEIRFISVLFARFRIYNNRNSNHRTITKIAHKISMLLRSECEASGTYIQDGSDFIFKLHLGVPLDTYPDNTFRLARLAFGISKVFKENEVDWSISITCGNCLCDTLGDDIRKDYIVTGLPMFLAARLVFSFENKIVCSSEVSDILKSRYDFNNLGDLKLKGFDVTANALELLVEKPLARTKNSMLGRDSELNKCLDIITSKKINKNRFVLIQGDAGIGKSLLVQQIVTSVCNHLKVFQGGAETRNYSVPYSAWRKLLIELLSANEILDSKYNLTDIINLRLSELQLREHGALLNQIFDINLSETEYSANLTGQPRVGATLDLLSALLTKCLPSPSLVIIEDAHWIDSPSWSLLQQITMAANDVVFVVTTRHTDENTELRTIRETTAFHRIALKPLSKKDSEELLDVILHEHNMDHVFLERLGAKAQGNPFHLIEYANYVQKKKKEIIENSQWAQSEELEKEITIPGTIHNIVASRVDMLSSVDSQIVKHASVLGKIFSFEILEKIVPKTVAKNREVLPYLKNLEQQELLRVSNKEKGTYSFAHDLIQESIYDSLKPTDRTALHKTVGELFEALLLKGDHSLYSTLSYHWSNTDDHDRTIRYSERAAENAIGVGAYQEAETLIVRCLENSNFINKKLNLSRQLTRQRLYCDALFGMGKQANRFDAAVEAFQYAGIKYPTAKFSLLFWTFYLLCIRLIMPPKTRQTKSLTEENFESIKQLTLLHRHASYASFFLNSPAALIYNALKAVNFAEKIQLPEELSGAYCELGAMLGVIGFRKNAYKLINHAVEIVDTTTDMENIAHVHMIKALYSLGVANWQTSESSAEMCRSISVKCGYKIGLCNSMIVHFYAVWYQGEKDRSMEKAIELETIGRQTGNHQHELWGLHGQIMYHIFYENFESAFNRLEDIKKIYIKDWDRTEDLPTSSLYALACWKTGQKENALTQIERTIDILKKHKVTVQHSQLEYYSAITEVVARALKESPNSSKLKLHYIFCIKVFKIYCFSFPIGIPRRLYWQGYLFYIEGNQTKAQRIWTKALSKAKQYKMGRDRILIEKALDSETVLQGISDEPS